MGDLCLFFGKTLPSRISEEKKREIWHKAISNYDNYMKHVISENHYSLLSRYRNEISDLCYQAAMTENRLYRLTVPTGAGKTFSSLRFALYHAEKYTKEHIFYVAPFNSIFRTKRGGYSGGRWTGGVCFRTPL